MLYPDNCAIYNYIKISEVIVNLPKNQLVKIQTRQIPSRQNTNSPNFGQLAKKRRSTRPKIVFDLFYDLGNIITVHFSKKGILSS